ncbi:MAG: outer membrane beta-barrel family protein [Bacteroidales bacterium]|nr:outer membrane beta-barrel family protein [Bacteroidales bacterium]
MKSNPLLKILALVAMVVLSSSMLEAQPGGFPGGQPPMGEGGRPDKRPDRPGRDWNQMGDSQQAASIKQKKKVREGDTFKVVGSLRDSVSGEFLAFVNVAVLEAADSSFVKGAATNLDGLFEVSGVPAGSYLLRISAIGYRNRLVPFTVSNNTALGTLRLLPGATTLDAVEITADKPLYLMDGEKLVYNVEDDPSIQTGTTEDALQNAPGVEVDVEGNISLRGVSSVEIWINDKPSKLTEENLKTYLQTLPANALARIETITNPSAKYATDAEAVINIITSAHIKSNQFVSFGVNGSNQPFVSPWVSYMWAKERLSVNLFASFRYSFRDNESTAWALTREDGTGGNEYDTVMRQTDTAASGNRSYGGNLFASVNYEIDSTSDIEFHGGFNINHNRTFSDRSTHQLFWPLDLDSLFAYSLSDTSTSTRGFGDLGVDYTKKFNGKGHNLRLGLRARLSSNASDEYYHRLYTRYTDLDENRYLLGSTRELGLDFNARYNRPYSKNGEFSYGLKLEYDDDRNTFDRYYLGAGGSYDSVDALRTYELGLKDAEASFDVNWTHRFGNLTVSSGLGVEVEHTDYQYATAMTQFADDSAFTHFKLRPSIHLTYRTPDMHNFKLNYSLRMKDPSYKNLTRFRTYGEDSYSTGNPAGLAHSYTHNAEAGWAKYFERFGNVSVDLYGRLSTNEISSLTESKFDEFLDRWINFSMPYNMGTSWRYGGSLNLTYRPSGFFNVRLYANVYDYGYRLENYRGRDVQEDKWSWSLRLNAWAKVFDQYQLTASFNYTSPTLGLMSTRKERLMFNIGARSDFFNRKLSVFINIQDLFNWGASRGSGSENSNPYYLSESTQKMLNSRYISAGITLRFGKMELEKGAKDGSSEAGDSLGE